MPDPFLLKKALTALALPPIGPLLVALLGLLLLARSPRLGRALAWLGFGALLALSLPLVADALLLCVDDTPPLDLAQARDAQAIVILGGGVRGDAAEYGGDTLGRLTLERVRYGAWVARRTHLPVLVSGGRPQELSAEATVMKRALEEEFGVEVRWAEAQSRNTHENAVNSARILHAAGIRHVILVAHSFDMPRAGAELAAAGLQVTLAPTGLPGKGFEPGDLVPSVPALQSSYYALYELLANAVRRAGL